MTISLSGDVLSVKGLEALGEANSELFRRGVRAAWPASALTAVEIDFSQTQSLDSCGMGALLAVQRWAAQHSEEAIPVRLLNPQLPVQELLERARLHRTFEIVKR